MHEYIQKLKYKNLFFSPPVPRTREPCQVQSLKFDKKKKKNLKYIWPFITNVGWKLPEHVPVEKNTRDGSRERHLPSMTSVSRVKLPNDPRNSDSSGAMKSTWVKITHCWCSTVNLFMPQCIKKNHTPVVALSWICLHWTSVNWVVEVSVVEAWWRGPGRAEPDYY